MKKFNIKFLGCTFVTSHINKVLKKKVIGELNCVIQTANQSLPFGKCIYNSTLLPAVRKTLERFKTYEI